VYYLGLVWESEILTDGTFGVGFLKTTWIIVIPWS